jgi:TolA-binding protein
MANTPKNAEKQAENNPTVAPAARGTVANKQVVTEVVKEEELLDNIIAGYDKNKQRINTAIIAVIVLVAGYFGYQELSVKPTQKKAANALAFAQQNFQRDSITAALDGEGNRPGFVKIASKYGGTPAGNLANYYAGVCYLQQGDIKKAIKHLKEFNSKGTSLTPAAAGALADAYMEDGKVKDSISQYQTASADEKNTALTPIYLLRLAMAYEMNKQPEKAIDAYKKLRDNYPQSQQAREVDKNLARLGELQ